ncbi:MAG: nucleotidyltransferase domain-containing protein [Candidatus Aenigmatarchaeota archaeon]
MVNIYKIRLTVLQQKILRLLFVKAGTSLNQRQIANLLGVSQPAVMKSLPGMEGMVRSSQDKTTKRWSVELNRDDHRAMQMKRADNLMLIYETGLADFLEREFAGATLILFGSYSRGEDTMNSDVDVAVIGRKGKKTDLAAYERALERKINLNFYDSLRSVHKNLRENLCNGIVISGGVEL